jgi:hypothetical protein
MYLLVQFESHYSSNDRCSRLAACTGVSYPGTSNQATLVKILVPVGVILLLLLAVIMVLIVTVGVVCLRKKRANSYDFQRVAFTNGNGEDEED